MIKPIKVKNIKVGEDYFFPDTDFNYSPMFKVSVRKERINKIIDGEFSTKNIGDKYERQRFIGFKTEVEALSYLVNQIRNRKKQIIDECNDEIRKLIKSHPAQTKLDKFYENN